MILATFDWQEPESIALVVMGVIELVTLWFLFVERREKKREKADKEKAESQLVLIRRRGDAPLLVPSSSRFNMTSRSVGNGRLLMVSPMDGAVLCEFRNEVNIPAGQEQIVVFVVENIGERARAASVKLDDGTAVLQQEAEMEGARGRLFLIYPYDRAVHGQEQKLTLTFESQSGIQDTHTYSIRHGVRFLRRIEPPLPL